ncbi:ragulator complex protein LAMTOR1-like [Limulus polyphemus]|uniref:Ragulator complex protein LAMTOR1 n=1 Tax=Limulus polyphemus TaxID=6850 RepID=A0ABM1BNI7_LIMPO|nr:ragulator complex protein LAMTOR1-like [Limulus polyphemus]
MGCCFSNDDDKGSQVGDPHERTTLLGNPVSNSSTRPGCDDYGSGMKYPHNQRADEQSALNRILHETATNVIDVSAMNSHLEQHEYLDRARQYNQRVAATAQKYTYPQKRPSLLLDLPATEKNLSASPIPQKDLKLLKSACENAVNALQEIKVQHQEELVVQFGIP